MTPFRHSTSSQHREPIERYARLALASAIIGVLCALLSDSLKKASGYCEQHLLGAAKVYPALFVLLPIAGFLMIYMLRQYFFKQQENKGIAEISEALKSVDGLPAYKIASHYINGLITVAFGGSTGTEASAIVASATIGSVSQQRSKILHAYKTELICAGAAAGITALFSSPIAGILFSIEVLTRKVSKAGLLCSLVAVSVAWLLNSLISEAPLFDVRIATWHTHAIPYFILLGLFAGLHSAYLTKTVFFFKKQFAKLNNHAVKIATGSAIIGVMLLLFPQLYGEGYYAVKEISQHPGELIFNLPLLLSLAGIILLKPVITSVTLASGGGGGILAPSIFMGAFLGLLVSGILNTFFHTEVIPLNFMIIGMAAVLSASIHAPFTAIFLVCGLVGSYALIIPIFIGCAISKLTSMMVYPYTVYTLPAPKY